MIAAKAVVQLVMTILAALIPALTVGVHSAADMVNVVILATGVIMVYVASNDIPGWKYVKLAAATVSAVAVVLVSALTGGIDAGEWIQMALAAAAVLGVGAVANKPADAPSAVIV